MTASDRLSPMDALAEASAAQAPAKTSTSSASSSTSNPKKRDRSEAGDSDKAEKEDFTPEELAKMSRSERKRHREKKRRSDVNKGFDDLMTLLLEIDPVVRSEAEDRARRGQWKGNLGAHEDNLLSRVDLISRTVEVLRKIHDENEQRKAIIDQLVRAGSNNAPRAPAAVVDNRAVAAKNAASSADVALLIPLLAGSAANRGAAAGAPNAAGALPSYAALRQAAVAAAASIGGAAGNPLAMLAGAGDAAAAARLSGPAPAQALSLGAGNILLPPALRGLAGLSAAAAQTPALGEAPGASNQAARAAALSALAAQQQAQAPTAAQMELLEQLSAQDKDAVTAAAAIARARAQLQGVVGGRAF